MPFDQIWEKTMQPGFLLKVMTTAVLALVIAHRATLACTAIILHSEDGATIPARTMEFGIDLNSDIVAVPAGTKFKTLMINPDKNGFSYEAKYGFVGANGFGLPVIVDGMNTQGLYFGSLYFTGAVALSELTDENQSRAVSAEEIGNWILSQFATVEEVREALPSVAVVGTFIEAIGGTAPVHFTVVDENGGAIVIEYTKSGLHIYDNTVNAMTNNPPFDWHLTNLRNYIGLSVENRSEITVGSQTLKPFGQGTGLAGLPGDFTSPSRFARAVAFANATPPAKDAQDGVFKAFHILNAFDIPKGAIREKAEAGEVMDYTVWTSVADTRNRVYYYKSYLGQVVESVDVRKAVENLEETKTVGMNNDFTPRDRTSDF